MAYLLVTEHWQKHVYKQNFYMLKSGTTDYLQSMWTFVTVYRHTNNASFLIFCFVLVFSLFILFIIPPANKVFWGGGYIGITLSVRPCTL